MSCHVFKYARMGLAAMAVCSFLATAASAAVVVQSISDGFGDADRNNDGSITFYDTDINLSDTWNDPVEDMDLADRGIIEVTSAEDAGDTGIVWLATRGFTGSAQDGDPKSNLKIINDDVPTGAETSAHIHNNGLALGVESKGTGSSFIGRFGESIQLGPLEGDKVVASVDFRFWREADNQAPLPVPGELRWGLWQDTDNELGTDGPHGKAGATATWGLDDGDWFSGASTPGTEGDKGIYTRLPMISASPDDTRIQWEHNVSNINGTSNNGRFFEGSGVSNTPGSGGDVGTVALPPNDGTGGLLATLGPHTLSMEIIRLADGLVQVATFLDGSEMLRDEIKTTDTGFAVIGPPAFTYDYIGFRNSVGDYDYVIDNFLIQSISVVPEPASLILMGWTGLLLALRRPSRIA